VKEDKKHGSRGANEIAILVLMAHLVFQTRRTTATSRNLDVVASVKVSGWLKLSTLEARIRPDLTGLETSSWLRTRSYAGLAKGQTVYTAGKGLYGDDPGPVV
jgi:hypothetical protein